MSGICGVLRIDGAPAGPDTVDRMLHAMARWGDGGGARASASGRVRLGCRQRRITAEDRFEAQPLLSAGALLVADARLDNRTELFAELGVPVAARGSMADSALLAAAFEAWGEDVARRLVGDFAFILWDERRQTLLAARDRLGQRGLFWNANAHRLLIASSARAVVAAGDVAVRLNEQKVADALALLEDARSTYYAGVERVPAGHLLIADPAGHRFRRYARLESQRPLRLGSDREYIEGFRSVFDEAVRARLRAAGDTGVMLSGGLDSASVAGVAATQLHGMGQRLAAFHAAPRLGFEGDTRPGWIVDETADVMATAALHENIELIIHRPDGTSPWDHFDLVFETVGAPIRNPSNLAWYVALHGRAADHGVAVLLTGQKGNLTISFTGVRMLRDLMRRGHALRALSEARALARARGRALRPVLWSELIRPLVPLPLFRLNRWLRRRSAAEPDVQESGIAPAFARAMRVEERMRERRADAETLERAGGDDYRILALEAGADGLDVPHLFRAFRGIEMRDPTADIRVIDYCLSIPADQYLRGGRDRLLVRRSMRGLLPDSLLRRTTRGAQAADWTEWFGAMRPAFAAELENLMRSDTARRCLDLSKLRSLIEHWPDRFGMEHHASYNLMLLRAMMMGRFIRWFEAAS